MNTPPSPEGGRFEHAPPIASRRRPGLSTPVIVLVCAPLLPFVPVLFLAVPTDFICSSIEKLLS